MAGLRQEEGKEIIQKGWIIHATKKRNLGSNFDILHDKRTGRYCDPTIGWVEDKPNKRAIRPYDHRRKRNRLGMEAIFNFEDHEGAVYFFSLYADTDKVYWEMDGLYVLVDIPKGLYCHAGMMEDGEMRTCIADDLKNDLLNDDSLYVSSVLTSGDKIFPSRPDIGRLFMSALGETELAYGSLMTLDKTINRALGFLNNSVLTSVQMRKILSLYRLMFSSVGDGAMLRFLSNNSCIFALDQLLVISKTRAHHNWITHRDLHKDIFSKISSAVKKNLRLEVIENILQVHNVMKKNNVDDFKILISYLNNREKDIAEPGRRFQMIAETEAMLKRVVQYDKLSGWKEELK